MCVVVVVVVVVVVWNGAAASAWDLIGVDISACGSRLTSSLSKEANPVKPTHSWGNLEGILPINEVWKKKK